MHNRLILVEWFCFQPKIHYLSVPKLELKLIQKKHWSLGVKGPPQYSIKLYISFKVCNIHFNLGKLLYESTSWFNLTILFISELHDIKKKQVPKIWGWLLGRFDRFRGVVNYCHIKTPIHIHSRIFDYFRDFH